MEGSLLWYAPRWHASAFHTDALPLARPVVQRKRLGGGTRGCSTTTASRAPIFARCAAGESGVACACFERPVCFPTRGD